MVGYPDPALFDRNARIKALWENRPDLTAKQIAKEVGTTKNVVVGVAYRAELTSRRVYQRKTTAQRLEELEKRYGPAFANS